MRRTGPTRRSSLALAALLVWTAACGDKAPPKDPPPAPPATPSATPETPPPAPPPAGTPETPPPTEATPPPAPAGNPEVEALLKEGKVKYALGDFQASREALAKALQLEPDNAEAKAYLARAEAALDGPGTAPPAPATPTVLTPREQDRAKSIDVLLKEAEALLKEEKFALPPEENAFIKLRAVLEKEPLNRKARAGIAAAIDSCKKIGIAAMEAGDHMRALTYLAQAESMSPSDPEIRELVTRCRSQMTGGTLAPAPTPTVPATPSPAPTTGGPPAVPMPAEPAPAATPPPVVDGRRAAWLKAKAPAMYPRSAWDKGVEGTVVLKLLVAPDGKVADVQVQSSSGVVELDQAAVDASRAYSFEPALEGGRRVAQWVSVAVTFDKP